MLIAAADVPLLAALAREGARALVGHGRLPPRARSLLAQLEEAAIVSAHGSAVGVGGPHAASSRHTTAEEAGAVLNLSARRVRQMLAAGELLGERVGGVWLVDALDLAAVARRRQGQQREAS